MNCSGSAQLRLIAESELSPEPSQCELLYPNVCSICFTMLIILQYVQKINVMVLYIFIHFYHENNIVVNEMFYSLRIYLLPDFL